MSSSTSSSSSSPPPPPQPESESESESEPCRLLDLPGELKNRIYRYVLLQPKHPRTRLSATGHERPDLLRTCKTIHSEALEIYYLENSFSAEIYDYDCAPLLKWHQLFRDFRISCRKVAIKVRGEPSWGNLLQWLRLYHHGSVHGNPSLPRWLKDTGVRSEGIERYVVGGMFDTVAKLRRRSWEIVLEIVSGLRPTLIAIDSRWAQD